MAVLDGADAIDRETEMGDAEERSRLLSSSFGLRSSEISTLVFEMVRMGEYLGSKEGWLVGW